MALTTLAHTRSIEVPAAQTISAYLDSIYNRLAATSTWTPTKETSGPDTVAVYAVPVATEVADLRIVFAGVDAGAPTPTMASPDTFATSIVLVGISRKVTGAYGAWDDANPFADGDFSGYWQLNSRVGWAADDIQVYASAETIWVGFRRATQVMGAAVGALFSSDDNSLINSEDGEGRVYGMVKSSTNFAWISHTGSVNTSSFGGTSTSVGKVHAGAFQPMGSWENISRMGIAGGMTVVGQGLTLEGNAVLLPQYFFWDGLSPEYFLGRFREVYATTPAQHGQQVLGSGGSPLGLIIAESISVDKQAIALLV